MLLPILLKVPTSEEIQAWLELNLWRLILSVIAILVAVVFILIMKIIAVRVKKGKNKRSYTVIKLVESIIKYIIIIIDIFVLLGIWGIDVTAALAGVGIVGLVVGLGAQDLIKDLIAGIGIVIDDQYDVDEVVEINGFKGKVTEIGLRTTRLVNATGEIRIIRNGSISDLSNFSRTFSVAIALIDISYDEDIDRVIKILDDNLPSLKDNYPQIIEGPIVVGVDALADSSVTIRVTAKTNPEDHYAVRRALLKYTKELFEQNDIEMPYPQVVVHGVEK